LGIIEKVEQLATAKSSASTDLSDSIAVATKSTDSAETPADIFSQEPMDVSPALSAASSILPQRSATSTPSISLLSDTKSIPSQSASVTPDQAFGAGGDRFRMLNIPVQVKENFRNSYIYLLDLVGRRNDIGHRNSTTNQ
jgi:hypothetical protein